VANSRTSEDQAGRRSDWFAGRRNHCIRQVLDDSLQLVQWFRRLQQRSQEACRQDCAKNGAISMDPETLAEWLRQWTIVLGTESNKGALWQLQDRCRQLWPSEAPSGPGVRLDWLIGSLFHEAVKLKENLCLLNNYCAAATDCSLASVGRGVRNSVGQVHDLGFFIDDVVGYVAQQTKRVGMLLDQVSSAVRTMLPDLLGNPLVMRLLAERESLLAELWGASLQSIFSEAFVGAAAGFCLAGESYLRGQRFCQALAMYERALGCDPQCNEARIRAAHLKVVLREHGAAV
jgi:hypothetical protein